MATPVDDRMTAATDGARAWLATTGVDCSEWSDSDVALVMFALDRQVDDFIAWPGADAFVASLGSESS